jgi:uncharacterized phage protein (predicted DNA packaging)
VGVLIVTLEEAKLYLKVDGDEDDTLISDCINAAEELCEDILRFPLTEFAEVPDTVKQAVLYAIGNLYEQRETLDMKAMIDLLKRLLFAYRKDGW